MSKSILQIILSCSVQKPAPKNTKYSRNASILKIGHHAFKGCSPCKILTLAQKLKFRKTCQNPFYKSFRVVLCKNPLQKTGNIWEITAFWKSAIMHAKAIAHAKSSLWLKKLNSKKHVKIHSTNHFELFCAKTRSKKTLHIGEMRAFWKSAIMHAKAIAHAKSSLWLKN